MAIEDTIKIEHLIESRLGNSKEVNDYLKLGWTLLACFPCDHGDPGEIDGTREVGPHES
jgi:hypothetical protein